MTWDGESGDLLWFSDDNWNPNGVPGEMDSVTIDAGGRVLAESMPIDVISMDVLSGLELRSSSILVSANSLINDFLLSGCCTTDLDSGPATITYSGNHVFNKTPAFIGRHVIDGTALFEDTLIVRALSDLTINADATIMGGGARLDAGASASITGTLTLNNSSFNSPLENPDASWYFDGGNLVYTGTLDSIISDKVFVTSGTVSVDTKQLEFANEFVFQDTQVSVSNGGRIVFDLTNSATSVEVLEVTSFTGDGRIDLQGDVITMEEVISTSSVTGDGFWIRGALDVNGELRNAGIMQLRGGSVGGVGKLVAQSGTLSVVTGADLWINTEVRSGGTFNVDSAVSLTKDIRVESGGLMNLNAGITSGVAFPDPNPEILVLGELKLPNTNAAAPLLQDVQLTTANGGLVTLEDRTLNLRGGSDMMGGTVMLTDTATSGFPRLLLSGIAGDTHTLGGDVLIRNDDNRAEVNVGNGVGTQPNLVVNGDAYFRLFGAQSVAKFRVPSITSDQTNSRIINEGIMRLERTLHTQVAFVNRWDLRISGELTLDTASKFMPGIENDVDGTLTQVSNIIAINNSNIRNKGMWIVPNSYQIIPDGEGENLEAYYNQGTLQATGGTSSVDVFFDNEGGTVIADGAVISFSNATTLDGNLNYVAKGSWKAINNGLIFFSENGPDIFQGPDTEIEADSDDMPALNDAKKFDSTSLKTSMMEPNGDVEFVNSDAEINPGGLFSATGDLTITNDSNLSVNSGATVESLTNITSGSDDIVLPSVADDISGVIPLALGPTPPPTIIAPTIDIHANLTPIRDGIGVMNTSGILTIHPTGNLRINAEADGMSSQLNHTGDLEIIGNIQITPINAYQPQLGDSFIIATVNGTINSLPTQALGVAGDGQAYAINAVGNQVIASVVVACPADLNMDGSLNFLDISAFLAAYAAADPIADQNEDGSYNFLDVSAYLASYSNGCP